MTTIKCSNPSLVLSGGGMKAAAFHIGVALALKNKGFSIGNTKDVHSNPLAFKRYVGTSAGSVIATFFAAGFSVEDIIFAFTQGKHNLDTLDLKNLEPSHKLPSIKYKNVFSINLSTPSPSPSTWIPSLFSDGIISWGGIESLLKRAFKINGFFSTKGIGEYFQKVVLKSESTNFKDLVADLFIVATYLNHPKKAVFSKYHLNDDIKSMREDTNYITGVDVATAITASTALPPIFAPVKINGETFFDGEVRDSLSSHIALEHGSDLVVVSYSMEPYRINEEFGSLDTYGLPVILNQALYQMIQHKIVNHINSKDKLKELFNDLESILLKTIDKPKANKIIRRLEKKFFPDRNANVLYINPSSQDYEMFFADHLSLKPKILNKIITVGFKAAMNSLRDYEFKGK